MGTEALPSGAAWEQAQGGQMGPAHRPTQVLLGDLGKAGTCWRAQKSFFLQVWGMVQVGGACGQEKQAVLSQEGAAPVSRPSRPPAGPQLVPIDSMQAAAGWLPEPSAPPHRPWGPKPSWGAVGVQKGLGGCMGRQATEAQAGVQEAHPEDRLSPAEYCLVTLGNRFQAAGPPTRRVP